MIKSDIYLVTLIAFILGYFFDRNAGPIFIIIMYLTMYQREIYGKLRMQSFRH